MSLFHLFHIHKLCVTPKIVIGLARSLTTTDYYGIYYFSFTYWESRFFPLVCGKVAAAAVARVNFGETLLLPNIRREKRKCITRLSSLSSGNSFSSSLSFPLELFFSPLSLVFVDDVVWEVVQLERDERIEHSELNFSLSRCDVLLQLSLTFGGDVKFFLFFFSSPTISTRIKKTMSQLKIFTPCLCSLHTHTQQLGTRTRRKFLSHKSFALFSLFSLICNRDDSTNCGQLKKWLLNFNPL